jgi:ERCC4-type nuclease
MENLLMELNTMDDFVEWIVSSHTQQGLALHRHKYSEKKAAQNANIDSRIKVLMSVEGMTENKARGLLEKFGSIPNILKKKTTQKSLMEIKGVNRKNARAIISLREDYSTDEN